MPDFDIRDFTEDSFFQNLANDLIGPDEIRDDHVGAQYLARYLRDLSTKTIIVEYDYIDADYLDDFASFYARCFQPYHRRCKRLHFFACEIALHEFPPLILGDAPEEQETEFRKSYLGFVVARPLPNAIIGRTVLSTYPSDGGRRHYPCTRNYVANLFGIELSVRSLAFQEQDSVLAACATVSLWCAFHKTAELFGTPVPVPAEITRRANRVVRPVRPIPSRGLNLHQICNSIRSLDLEPEVVEVAADTPLVSLVYGHLRMGLPVLLVADVEDEGTHAITINGFSLRSDRIHNTEVAPDREALPMTGLRIDEFYGHDDQVGPFARLYVKPSVSTGGVIYPVVFDGSWIQPGTAEYLNVYPTAIVVPVYHKIRLTFLDVQIWLNRLDRAVFRPLLSPEDRLKVEWDVHLQKSNDYKSLVRDSGLAKTLIHELLLFRHPRFIWRVMARMGGVDVLELLVDATDMARSFPIYKAVWHTTGIYEAVNDFLLHPESKSDLLFILTKRFYDLLTNTEAPRSGGVQG